ncbi:MAG TPA: hypothetical protein VES89_08845 [Candidatus Competibacteraceae bacterium]|nr:hypothetical protein [Candidatus Competibacteraceae bacterium]
MHQSGKQMTLSEVAQELGERLTGIFLRSADGRRPVYGRMEKFQTDPHWRDLHQFYEYFNGDTGAGIGANHQTGWTGCVARIIEMNGSLATEVGLDLNEGQISPSRLGKKTGL